MKRSLWIVMTLCMLFTCSCSKNEEPELEKQTLVVNDSDDENIKSATEITTEFSGDSKSSTAVETDISETGSNMLTDTKPYESNPQNESFIKNNIVAGDVSGSNVIGDNNKTTTVHTEISRTDDDPIGDSYGKTEAEWLVIAQELYKEGCDVAFRYLCTGSEFPFDRENLEIIDKTYFLTTCNSFEEATAPYYQLFSREYHGSDFEGLLLSQNDRLYAARSARGMDMTYLSSEVKQLVSVSDKEIVFSVLLEYEDGETTAEFTLVPEDGELKIGKFTLPY